MIMYSIFLVGYGIHWTADAVDILQHGVELKGTEAEVRAQELAYFLDEILGHKLTFYPLYGILLLLAFSEYVAELSALDIILGIVAGILLALFMIIGSIEGLCAYEAVAFAVALLGYTSYKVIAVGVDYPATRPMALITSFTMSVVMLAVAVNLVQEVRRVQRVIKNICLRVSNFLGILYF